MKLKVAIIGSGPAALMAASQIMLRSKDTEVHIYEKRSGLGRKLLIAGSSGLNISNSLPHKNFVSSYTSQNPKKNHWDSVLKNFSKADWISFIEKELKHETFLGTSDRYFVREMKASNLLKSWVTFLEDRGVKIYPKHTLSGFESKNNKALIQFLETPGETFTFDKVIFALGGGSWEEREPEWCELFRSKGLNFESFKPSNVGFEVTWPKKLLAEAEGKPLKKIRLTTKRGSKMGELVITSYGLEGTPIYFVGEKGDAKLDLKPDLEKEEILERLNSIKENLAPIRRVKQKLNLSDASLAVLFHMTSDEDKKSLPKLVDRIKSLSIRLNGSRPLSESISSSGGLSYLELSDTLELKKFPNFYACGEMLDWDAPTGGFLIQGSVSEGAWVAHHLKN